MALEDEERTLVIQDLDFHLAISKCDICLLGQVYSGGLALPARPSSCSDPAVAGVWDGTHGSGTLDVERRSRLRRLPADVVE
jgi:hypothetical protein